MTLAEIIAEGAAGFSIVAALGNTLYTRGKLDAHGESATKRLDSFETTINRLDGLSDTLRDKTGVTAEGLRRHEDECLRRQDAIEKRFDRLDRVGENIAAQVARMTPPDTFVEIIPPRGRRINTEGGT